MAFLLARPLLPRRPGRGPGDPLEALLQRLRGQPPREAPASRLRRELEDLERRAVRLVPRILEEHGEAGALRLAFVLDEVENPFLGALEEGWAAAARSAGPKPATSEILTERRALDAFLERPDREIESRMEWEFLPRLRRLERSLLAPPAGDGEDLQELEEGLRRLAVHRQAVTTALRSWWPRARRIHLEAALAEMPGGPSLTGPAREQDRRWLQGLPEQRRQREEEVRAQEEAERRRLAALPEAERKLRLRVLRGELPSFPCPGESRLERARLRAALAPLLAPGAAEGLRALEDLAWRADPSELQAWEEVQRVRVLAGRRVLAPDRGLLQGARGWAWRLGRFDLPLEHSPRAGSGSFSAENLMRNAPSPKAAVDVWLRSPPHCRNLLDPSWSRGAAGGAQGVWCARFA